MIVVFIIKTYDKRLDKKVLWPLESNSQAKGIHLNHQEKLLSFWQQHSRTPFFFFIVVLLIVQFGVSIVFVNLNMSEELP